MFSASKIQVTTYLVGVCLSSISLLVFVNATISFVVTNVVHQKTGVGDAVGSLGFADELLALIACPIWGLLSDRIGARSICAISYSLMCVALILFVQAHDVVPQLLLVRLLFSVGASGTATMITALLPTMTAVSKSKRPTRDERHQTDHSSQGYRQADSQDGQRTLKSVAPREHLTTRSAGFVGLFTGLGALLALLVFLRLPDMFERRGSSREGALTFSYYVVAAVALLLSLCCLLGLRGLRDGATAVSRLTQSRDRNLSTMVSLSFRSLLEAFVLAFRKKAIGLAYIGGVVARASSIGITLFIPLFVNIYFVNAGYCDDLGRNPSDIKLKCKDAYVLAAELTGVSQLIALVSAPLFGYFAERYRRFNIGLLLAAAAGIFGYFWLASMKSPRPNGEDGNPWIFLVMALIGISQIGAIVCSLGLLSRTILEYDQTYSSSPSGRDDWLSPTSLNDDEASTSAGNDIGASEEAGLLRKEDGPQNLESIKGAIAGVYSFGGGLGILFLTKVGGRLFDSTPAAPFYILASLNCLLLGVGIVCALLEHSRV